MRLGMDVGLESSRPYDNQQETVEAKKKTVDCAVRIKIQDLCQYL